MCGITGWVDWRRDLTRHRDTVDAMTATLACRGPDDAGTWVSPHAAVGHRRLAVIDVEGGRQPMTARLGPGTGDAGGAGDARDTGDTGDTVVLTFSGEIYNFAALRTQLAGHGHGFATRSDTEVLLRAYLQWGLDCLPRLDGMFAFAVWDGRRRELVLARDRLGVKPLYLHAYDGGVLFGSEPKALLANPLFRPELDDEGLAELFAMFGSHTPGRTALRGLEEVRPGHVVRVGADGVRTRAYWRLAARPHGDDPATTVRTVRDLLGTSVEQRLVSDVPLCALVSGGVDSSAIAALASGSPAGPGPDLATFAVDFAGSAEDFVADAARPDRDAPHVERLVAHLATRHTDVVLDTPDLLGVQSTATRARDLPCLGDLDASLYLLFAAIRGRSTVALSGESADEVFGGYGWFHDADAVARPSFPWAVGGAGFARVLSEDVRARVRPEEYVADRYADALAEVPHLDGEAPDERRMREVCHLALTRHLPMLLDRKDRMSMAVGLEVRVPFCDHRLVEYVWNTPWALKTAGGTPKGLLREAVRDLLPPDLVSRPKSVFPAPPDPTYDARVREAARRLVEDDSAVGPLLDPARVRALVEGDTPRPPWMQRLALAYLVQVDGWMRTYDVRLPVAV